MTAPVNDTSTLVVFVRYPELPEPIRNALLEIEGFIGDMDGKTICTPTNGNRFIDEGTVDADDAVRAFNEIVAALRKSPVKEAAPSIPILPGQMPGAPIGVDADAFERPSKPERLREALEAIAGFGSVNLSGEYEHGLRDIIRSMTDCARDALSSGYQQEGER
jgi:hypothetical protein